MFIPEGFNTIAPYFVVQGAPAFIEFLVDGLGGVETLRHLRPDGTIANSQVRLGTSTVMVGEASPRFPAMTGQFYLYVEDADAAVAQALAQGGVLESPVADQVYGDRQGGVRDPHGNVWWISQRLVDAPYTA